MIKKLIGAALVAAPFVYMLLDVADIVGWEFFLSWMVSSLVMLAVGLFGCSLLFSNKDSK